MDRDHWTKQLCEAELEAARKPTEVKAAAKRLQRARAELKELEDEPAKPAKRHASRGRASEGVSSITCSPSSISKPDSSRCSTTPRRAAGGHHRPRAP
jgi:hypothetical protein